MKLLVIYKIMHNSLLNIIALFTITFFYSAGVELNSLHVCILIKKNILF